MTERICVAVKKDHALAACTSLTFNELDGTDFLMLDDIGVWNQVVRENLPHSHFFIQKDREVFDQLSMASSLAIFVSDLPSLRGAHPDRIRIPVDEDIMSVTYYLMARADATQTIREIMDWVRNAH